MNIIQQMISEICADVVFRLSMGHVFINLTVVCGKEENKKLYSVIVFKTHA
jgi:hypothetical protein